MIWAQWTLLVLSALSFLSALHDRVTRVRGPIIKSRQSVGGVIGFVVIYCAITAIYAAAGCFDRIFGWPD